MTRRAADYLRFLEEKEKVSGFPFHFVTTVLYCIGRYFAIYDKGDVPMKKKPFWRRVNRGFVVSLALLAIVAVYVLVTQLMLLPDKQAVRSLAEEVCAIMESGSMLSEAEIAALQDPDALEDKKEEICDQLGRLFSEDSSYADDIPSDVGLMIDLQAQGMQTLKTRGDRTENRVTCQIDQDTATVSVYRTYENSAGVFWDYSLEEAVEGNAQEILNCSIVCKKTDGVWKIYRISNLYMTTYTTRYH